MTVKRIRSFLLHYLRRAFESRISWSSSSSSYSSCGNDWSSSSSYRSIALSQQSQNGTLPINGATEGKEDITVKLAILIVGCGAAYTYLSALARPPARPPTHLVSTACAYVFACLSRTAGGLDGGVRACGWAIGRRTIDPTTTRVGGLSPSSLPVSILPVGMKVNTDVLTQRVFDLFCRSLIHFRRVQNQTSSVLEEKNCTNGPSTSVLVPVHSYVRSTWVSDEYTYFPRY